MDRYNIWHQIEYLPDAKSMSDYVMLTCLCLFFMSQKSQKIFSKPFELLLYKINSFHFAVVCSVIDAQKRSERGKARGTREQTCMQLSKLPCQAHLLSCFLSCAVGLCRISTGRKKSSDSTFCFVFSN